MHVIMPQHGAFLFSFLPSPPFSFLWSAKNLCQSGNHRDTKGSKGGRRSSIVACLLIGCYCGFQSQAVWSLEKVKKSQGENEVARRVPLKKTLGIQLLLFLFLPDSQELSKQASGTCSLHCVLPHWAGSKQQSWKTGMNPRKAHATADFPFLWVYLGYVSQWWNLINPRPPPAFREYWGWNSTPGFPSKLLLFLDFIYQRGSIKIWGCNADGGVLP